jgi:Fe-S oxidoreductase
MIERINFWGIPEPWHYVAYILPLAAGLYMVVRVLLRMRTWWQVGRPTGRWDRLHIRLWRLVQHAILQIKVLRQRYPGLMHISIAWGFFVLFLGTALATIDADIFKFLRGNIYLAFKFGLDLFTFVAFVGLGLAAYRRFRVRPARLTLSNEFGLALLALSLIVLSGLLTESLRLAAIAQDPGLQPGWEPALAWSTPAGWIVAQLWLALGLSPNALAGTHLALWVFHLGLVSVILVVIPTTSLSHLLISPVNIFFSKLDQPLGKLSPAVDFEQGLAGAAVLSDFTWKQLMDSEACTECGRCQDACPAHASGQPLSPKEVILAIASQVAAARANGVGAQKATFTGEIVNADVLWACTTCGACVAECPVMIDHVGTIVDMRCYLVDQARIDPQLQTALDNLGRYGNSFGQSDRMRAKWSQPIEPKIKDARREPVRYLWFLGDFASYHSGLSETTRKTAHVLQAAGVDFGILYEGEKNSGNDVRRVGEEGLFEMLVEDNVAALEKASYETIVTTDPHTYNTLKNEYPPQINGSRPILHYAQLLDSLLSSGQLRLSKQLGLRVTYHDPCYLGRYNGIYDAPRRVIEATGCELVELPRNREQGFCCGAGGGRIWMEETDTGERPSESRIKEACTLEEVGTLVVACPKDFTMYADAVKTTGQEQTLVVRDLIDLVYEAL